MNVLLPRTSGFLMCEFSLLSLSFLLFPLFLFSFARRFFSFPSNIPGTFSLFTPASSPSALSDLALCWSQSFFQLPVSHILSVNSLSPRSQIPPSVCLWSSQAAIWGLSLERCCWHNKQVTSWDTQKSTSDAVALSLCQRHKHTQLTSNTHTHINTHSEQQLSTHRCLHQKQFVSCTFCTSRHLHSNTYTDTHINALQLKIAYTLTSQHTQISISNILTVPFFFSLPHTHLFFTPHIMPAVSETCSMFPLSTGPHTRQKTSLWCFCSLQTKCGWFSWTKQSTFVSLTLQYVGYYI